MNEMLLDDFVKKYNGKNFTDLVRPNSHKSSKEDSTL